MTAVSGAASAITTVRRFAEAIAGLSPAEHGFSHLDIEGALRRAELLDALPAARRGTWHGRLVPIKDLMDVAGMPTTFGSAHRTRMATESSELVEYLLAQGVIIPGKTATPELGMTGYTEPVGLPSPVNPRWPGERRTPGGSSGGAAVAVARGLVDIAHASDGGGSIRIPAAACGVVGFKPSHRAVGGALSVQGMITRTLADTAFAHNLVLHTPERLKIGILTDPLLADTPVDPLALQAVDLAAGVLSDAGHDLVPLRASAVDAEGLFRSFREVFSHKVSRVSDPASEIVSWFRETAGTDTPVEAIERLEGSARELARAWEVDVLLSPMLAFAPPQIGAFSALGPADDFEFQTRWSPWGSTFNMSGGAALSLPLQVGGPRPVSIQLGAIRTDNTRILGLATQLEQLTWEA
ncbi:amidase [Corynebacterium sp. A21]|uniref:amidase n=1 Tax=Corynebacterium sp. A21 TaxID=3457318 RepID=UPI003FCF8A0F